MTNPLAAADFFALEAGECLDRLEKLAGRDEAPPAEDFLRASRVLRGSALMASQQAIARAAGGMESVARALREGRRAWDPECKEQVAQAIEEFRFLVRRVREWDDGDTVRAGRLALSLEGLAGRAAPEPAERRGEGGELNSGVRAFVGREGALIASALDRAARALQVAPGEREPLYTVIRRMQSLRGLAELGDLVPLPEILDGIELAVGDLTRLFAPPPGVHEVMAAGAIALTRLSRDIAEHGRPDPEAEEARLFTDLLLRAFAVERDVVPIESLYHDGDPQPSTPPPGQPHFEAPAPLGPLELVSHGEHLCQIADLIARARSATERDLRLYHLIGALRAASAPGPDPVAGALAVFARSTREALAAGMASRSTDELVADLKAAGELLRSVADAGDRMQVSRRILDVAHKLDQVRSGATELEARAQPAAVPDADVVPIESLQFDARAESEADVVPIARLAPDSEPAQAGVGSLETSFRTLERLQRERGSSPASLEVLLGRVEPAADAVAIGSLCYRGRSALERAAAVRQTLAAELAGVSDLAAIRPLLQELLDLVPLALDES
jgi:chemotaxis protein histidine kinase CheA